MKCILIQLNKKKYVYNLMDYNPFTFFIGLVILCILYSFVFQKYTIKKELVIDGLNYHYKDVFIPYNEVNN